MDCSDDDGDLIEEVLPSAGDRYDLVVPNASPMEGSYGKDAGEMQRPPGQSVCEDVLIYGLCAA